MTDFKKTTVSVKAKRNSKRRVKKVLIWKKLTNCLKGHKVKLIKDV